MSDQVKTEEVQADARNRAWRTFLQGLAIDVSIALILILTTAFSTIEWTGTYWIGLGLTLARTLLQSAVSYLMRVFVAPRVSRI